VASGARPAIRQERPGPRPNVDRSPPPGESHRHRAGRHRGVRAIGLAIRRPRRAIGQTEFRNAARIGRQIMTLGRGRRMKFPQNIPGLIAPDQVRAICTSPMAKAKPVPPCPTALLPPPPRLAHRLEQTTKWGRSRPIPAAAGPGECRVAIEPTTLHKEGEGSTINHPIRSVVGRLWSRRVPMLQVPMLQDSQCLGHHHHCLCCISTVCVKRRVL